MLLLSKYIAITMCNSASVLSERYDASDSEEAKIRSLFPFFKEKNGQPGSFIFLIVLDDVESKH